MSLRSTRSRYGSVAIGLHWLTALIILAMLPVGFLMEDAEGSTRLLVYRLHAAGGITVLVLTVIRLLWRTRDPKPELPADMGALTRLGARGAHVALYIILLAMTGSGIGILILGGLGDILSGASSQPIPRDFDVPPADAHEILAVVLLVFLALHIAAALYHHLIRRDDILRRMLPGG